MRLILLLALGLPVYAEIIQPGEVVWMRGTSGSVLTTIDPGERITAYVSAWTYPRATPMPPTSILWVLATNLSAVGSQVLVDLVSIGGILDQSQTSELVESRFSYSGTSMQIGYSTTHWDVPAWLETDVWRFRFDLTNLSDAPLSVYLGTGGIRGSLENGLPLSTGLDPQMGPAYIGDTDPPPPPDPPATETPEPSTWIAGLGLLAIAAARCRSRQRSRA